jgi:hypothetical protein
MAVPGTAVHNAIMPEIITGPEILGAARRQLQQAPLSALIGFADPVPRPEVAGKKENGRPVPGRTGRPSLPLCYTSNRSALATLDQAATKSWMNFSLASSAA